MMETLIVEKTEYTPQIEMDASKHLIDIKGDSFPENTYDFYKPVLNWIEAYFSTVADAKTVMNMEINYFNSSSSQLFFDLFDILEAAVEKGATIDINWIYVTKNESSMEAGEDFKEEFESLKINLVQKQI